MGMAWRATVMENGERHVTPEEDTREHDLSPKCWCKPWLDDEVFVHQSADRREFDEPDARRRPDA